MHYHFVMLPQANVIVEMLKYISILSADSGIASIISFNNPKDLNIRVLGVGALILESFNVSPKSCSSTRISMVESMEITEKFFIVKQQFPIKVNDHQRTSIREEKVKL